MRTGLETGYNNDSRHIYPIPPFQELTIQKETQYYNVYNYMYSHIHAVKNTKIYQMVSLCNMQHYVIYNEYQVYFPGVNAAGA